ncbi:MAG: HlyD family secretion protein [Thermonemataceae bacterium]
MLNISPHDITGQIKEEQYKAFQLFHKKSSGKLLARLLIALFFIALLVAFLPWTQNIRSEGSVTALYPQQRPQDLNALIDGRIERWYIREGQEVEKGDTILFISEVKDTYFDPLLIERTKAQLDNKVRSVAFYQDKIQALEGQIEAIAQSRQLKLEQANNYLRQAQLKIQADSIDYEAATVSFTIADTQFVRQNSLFRQGLKSLTELETRRGQYQTALAKKISEESVLLSSRNALLNARIELNAIFNEYTDKLQKARSEQFTAKSDLQETRVDIAKLENQLTNYQIRAGYYYVTAPQKGYITQAIATGVGENIKAGDPLVTIMPYDAQLAMEMYVTPRDLPLVHVGAPIRIIFDGWPSIIFSGWPIINFGTFSGKVVAIDRFINGNGKYRVLVAPAGKERDWPEALRVGGGANGLALLNDVPVWYEVWRQVNGFPPDYYTEEDAQRMAKK